MLLKRRIEQQPHKGHVGLVLIKRIKRDVVKHGEIVFLFDGRPQPRIFFPREPPGAVLTAFAVENCSVQSILILKMAKHHRLRDAGRLCNFPGGRAAKTSLRKKADSHAKDLQPPVFGGHSRSNYLVRDS